MGDRGLLGIPAPLTGHRELFVGQNQRVLKRHRVEIALDRSRVS
jgi:hypothetical protein